MYSLLHALLFRLDPETAHQFTLQLLRIGGIEPVYSILRTLYSFPSKPVQAFGLTFKNPVGLAAGYDKNAVAIKGLAALGFGHVEVGTVTPVPQPGNPRPRVWRLAADDALINALGFPSAGAARTAAQLAQWRARGLLGGVPLGANVGKNKDTPIDRAWDDYVRALETLYPHADYFVANISSPNTVGLRDLHAEMLLADLGRALAARARTLAPPGA